MTLPIYYLLFSIYYFYSMLRVKGISGLGNWLIRLSDEQEIRLEDTRNQDISIILNEHKSVAQTFSDCKPHQRRGEPPAVQGAKNLDPAPYFRRDDTAPN